MAVDERQLVLLAFADAVSAPEVLWSLTDGCYRVVALAKKGTQPAIHKSRFAAVHYVTDPADSVESCLTDMFRVICDLRGPVLMALDDGAVWLFEELRKRTKARVAGPVGQQARIALDKELQIEAARAAGFAVPRTWRVDSADDFLKVSVFPAIIKPAAAITVRNARLSRERMATVSDAHELVEMATNWNNMGRFLVQEFLQGVGEGVFGFAGHDGVVCWSGHRRIRMMNPAGSGASACVSTVPSEQVRQATERFLGLMGWRGLFMVELLRDQEDRLWFMELNGRCWGSMALARRMGFEYPAWAVRQALTPSFVPRMEIDTRRIECRHLGRELLYLAFVWRGRPSRAYKLWPGRMAAVRDVLTLTRGVSWYNWNAQDRRVFWADLRQTLSSAYRSARSRERRRSLLQRAHGRLDAMLIRRRQAIIRSQGEIQKLLGGAGRILFVCYGNINRSAFAEQHLRQLVGDSVQITSCGLHQVSGRPLDPMMRSLARDVGVRFEEWSSKTVDSHLISQADVIFAMEAAHLAELCSVFPGCRDRAFLLSVITPPSLIPLEIEDPHQKSPETYGRCIRHIMCATAAIATLIAAQVRSRHA